MYLRQLKESSVAVRGNVDATECGWMIKGCERLFEGTGAILRGAGEAVYKRILE